MEICTVKVRFATDPHDRKMWVDFQEIVRQLGKDGMSSDETTEDEMTHRPCFRVSILIWRRDMDAIMDKIDNERLSPQSGFSRRGSKPAPRFRQNRRIVYLEDQSAMAEDFRCSARQPARNLPLVFYDEQWLQKHSEDYVEHIICASREGFEWVKELAETYSTR